MVGVASRLTFALEVPFVVRDFDLRDIGWIKRNIAVATNLSDERATDDRDVADYPTVAESDVNYLIGHTGLRLTPEELCPPFWQARWCNHLTRRSSAAATGSAADNLWNYFSHKKM